MDFTGKKLLVLAGAGVHSKVVRAAKDMGIYTIVTDYLKDSPAKLIADESWMLNIMDTDAVISRCRQAGVDGVLNFCIDPAQMPYYEICTRLGLPCYGTKKEFDILTDKAAFKHYCTSHNVNVIPEYSADDVLNGRAEFPVLVKPAMSRGSRGQKVCFTPEEAVAALKDAESASFNGRALCEKYMTGKPELGTAFFAVNGEPYLVKLGDRLPGKPEDNMQRQAMCTRLPSRSSKTFTQKTAPAVKAMLKAMGVKFGPVFIQGFEDGETVRFFDPARRMPGGDYDLVLKKAAGFDTVKSMIHFALTGDESVHYGNPENSYLLGGGTCLLFAVSVRPGKIARVSGINELLAHPYVVYVRQIIPEGETIPDTGDIEQRVAAAGILIPEGESPSEFCEYFYRTYHVYDENGSDMIISRIDSDLL